MALAKDIVQEVKSGSTRHGVAGSPDGMSEMNLPSSTEDSPPSELGVWWALLDSNQGPLACEASALNH